VVFGVDLVGVDGLFRFVILDSFVVFSFGFVVGFGVVMFGLGVWLYSGALGCMFWRLVLCFVRLRMFLFSGCCGGCLLVSLFVFCLVNL